MVTSGSLTYYPRCAINLWCDAPSFGTGTCHKASQLGGPCNWEFYSCARGLHCSGYALGATSVQLGVCMGPSAAGGDCRGDDDCQTGLVCVSSVCKPPGLQGETCFSDSSCASGLVCGNQTCSTPLYPGDKCDATHACTLGRCVDGTCQPHAKVGQPCQAGSDCTTGSCVNGACNDNSVCQVP